MATSSFPACAGAASTALMAESAAANLHKCDAFWMASDQGRYGRHLDYALAQIDKLTAFATEARAAMEAGR